MSEDVACASCLKDLFAKERFTIPHESLEKNDQNFCVR